MLLIVYTLTQAFFEPHLFNSLASRRDSISVCLKSTITLTYSFIYTLLNRIFSCALFSVQIKSRKPRFCVTYYSLTEVTVRYVLGTERGPHKILLQAPKSPPYICRSFTIIQNNKVIPNLCSDSLSFIARH